MTESTGNQDTPERNPNDRVPDTATRQLFERSWPKPIGEAAFRGLIGGVMENIRNQTEADPNVLLIVALIICGNRMGRGRYVNVGADRHCGNLFGVSVGTTGMARKSSAISLMEGLLKPKERRTSAGARQRWVSSGLATGEGLVHALRDGGTLNPITRQVDRGVSDKRLMIRENEFARTLHAVRRPGSTLSAVLRDAFDHGNLSVLVKNQPEEATGAHLSLMGAITQEELMSIARLEDYDGGLFNRVLWFLSRRSRALPESTLNVNSESKEFLDEINDILELSSKSDQALTLTRGAQDLWGRNHSADRGLYAKLTSDRTGRWGRVTTRAAQMVLRLALIYAVLEYEDEVQVGHLEAALAVWDYCDESARYIFGEAGSGNHLADRILQALQVAGGGGMTRTEISKLLNNNYPAIVLTKALEHLRIMGLADCITCMPDGHVGRHPERWCSRG